MSTVHTQPAAEQSVWNTEDEEKEATTTSIELSAAQRAGLIAALELAFVPYVPFMPELFASALEAATACVDDHDQLTKLMPLVQDVDLATATRTADDQHCVALAVRHLMSESMDEDERMKGTVVAARTEQERQAIARVFAQVVRAISTHHEHGEASTDTVAFLVGVLMTNDECVQEFLDGTTGVHYAAMSNDDECRAVHFAITLFTKD